MLSVEAPPKSMKIAQVREKAQALGIKPGKMKKAELIHAIQRTEGNVECYGTAEGFCPNSDCCFIADCVK